MSNPNPKRKPDRGSAPKTAGRQRKVLIRLLLTGIVLGYWLAMFVGTHIPRPERIVGPDVSDKLLHFSAYFGLYALLVLRWGMLRANWPGIQTHAKYITITCCYAVADELLQGFPGVNRSPEVADALADAGGILSAAILALLGARFFPAKS